MNKGANAAGEFSIGVRNAGWVVGDEKAELEFGVVVENVKVLETNSCCVIVGYSRSTLFQFPLFSVVCSLTDDSKLFTGAQVFSAQRLDLLQISITAALH